jgi:hypothetical protein
MMCVQEPSSLAVLAEGTLSPRARRTPLEGAFNPRARQTSPEGASAVPPRRAAGATRVVIMSRACFRFVS